MGNPVYIAESPFSDGKQIVNRMREITKLDVYDE